MSPAIVGLVIALILAFLIAMALAFTVGALWGIKAEKAKRHIA